MKNYLIVGGSSGIGLRLARLLAQNGHHVYASYTSRLPGNEQANISYFKYDVLESENDFEDLPEKLDGLVYCPGAIRLKSFHRISSEDFVNDSEIQMIVAAKVILAMLPKLKAAEVASVVLFSTFATQLGVHLHSLVSTFKDTVEGLTRALAADFAPRIRVNCIAPSYTGTPLADWMLRSNEKKLANGEHHSQKSINQANDIIQAAIYLLGDQSESLTGQVLRINSGISAVNV